MSIPSHIEFALPVLEALSKAEFGLPRRELYERMQKFKRCCGRA